MFALLGLLIAFTFSGALTRFDERRGQVVAEANAIGTAYLRIDVLAPSTQPRLREAFRKYVDSRIATYRKLPDLQAAEHELQQSQQLQTEIWAQAVAAVRCPTATPRQACWSCLRSTRCSTSRPCAWPPRRCIRRPSSS